MSTTLGSLAALMITSISHSISGSMTIRLSEVITAGRNRLIGFSVDGPAPMAICPKAPPGAIEPVNELTGYIVWGVIILFGLALIIGLGAIVAGRIFSMPHASKVGVVSLVVVFAAAVAYLVLPGMLDGILGKGCIS